MRAVTRLRRSSAVVFGAGVLASALVLAGCGTSGSDSSSPPLPGVTDTTVKLGFSVVDLGELASALGFKQPNYGGYPQNEKVINSLVAYVNKNGGMGGRQVDATVKKYVGGTDSPVQSEAQCKGFVQDDRVMAAVLDGGYQNNTIPCFASAKTVLVLQSLLALDQKQFENYSPYLWSPTHPEYASFVKAQLVALNESGYFKDNSGVLLMPSDDEVSRRVTTTVVEPYLKTIGVTKTQSSYIDSTNTGTLGATAAAALTTGKNSKLNRVVVVGGARIQPVALSDQTAVGYTSTWAVSTYDNPVFTQNNPESIITTLREGMTGIGYAPAQDVDQEHGPAFPDPTNEAQMKCYDVVTAAGATPPDNLRNNWKQALLYCDAVFFLKATLDQLPGKKTITGAEFKEAAGKIGETYHSAMSFGSQWGPNVYAGTNAAKKLAWSDACSCFDYSGEVITFATTSGGAPSGAAANNAPATSAPPASAPAASTPADGSIPLETITVSP